jgi:putative transcriptional regulator
MLETLSLGDQESLTNHLLIAMPSLEDERFHESVIYVCGHDTQGAMGLIINKPITAMNFGDLVTQLNFSEPVHKKETPIYYGGPVEMGRGFVLHSADYQSKLTVNLCDAFAITASLEILQEVAKGRGPQEKVLALGYAGWSQGQLEKEIMANSWLTLKASPDLVFHSPSATLWDQALSCLGINRHNMALHAGHA